MGKAADVTLEPAKISVRAQVEVREENIRPWTGQVMSRKHSHVSGWWYDVRADDDQITRIINERFLEQALG